MASYGGDAVFDRSLRWDKTYRREQEERARADRARREARREHVGRTLAWVKSEVNRKHLPRDLLHSDARRTPDELLDGLLHHLNFQRVWGVPHHHYQAKIAGMVAAWDSAHHTAFVAFCEEQILTLTAPMVSGADPVDAVPWFDKAEHVPPLNREEEEYRRLMAESLEQERLAARQRAAQEQLAAELREREEREAAAQVAELDSFEFRAIALGAGTW